MFFAHMYHTTKMFLYVFIVPNAYKKSVAQNSKKLQKYTIIYEIQVKNKQFCHFFAKSLIKQLPQNMYSICTNANRTIHFYNIVSKNLQTYTKTHHVYKFGNVYTRHNCAILCLCMVTNVPAK